MRKGRWSRWILPGLVVALSIAPAATGLGGELQRLPGDLVYQQGKGSPGKVTFKHLTHVDQARPDCTGCHPALFKILKDGVRPVSAAPRHAGMEQGHQCGACHNGKKAFGLFQCPTCHDLE